MRVDWIDRWKGLLIVLVVSGHVFGYAVHASTGMAGVAASKIYDIIYLFHMPAFFWIAGMCWKSNDGFKDFVVKKTCRLLVPYLVFSVVSAMIYQLMDSQSLFSSVSKGAHYSALTMQSWMQSALSIMHAGGYPNGEGFRCNSVLWFLPAMFTASICYWIVDRYIKKKMCQLLLAAFLIVSFFFIRRYVAVSLPMGLSVLAWYLPFMIFGRWTPNFDLNRRYMFPLLSIVFVSVSLMLPNARRGYWFFGWYLIFTLMTMLGVVWSAIVARRINGRMMASIGLASMGIMLVHKFVVIAVQVKISPVRSIIREGGIPSILANIAVVVVSVVCSYGFYYLCHRFCPIILGESVRKK